MNAPAFPNFTVDAKMLKRVPVLAAIADQKLASLARTCRHRRYERGCTILGTGHASDGLYVLLAGRAKMVLENPEGRQITLGSLEATELIGQAHVFDEYKCATGIEALTACEVLHMLEEAFLECIEGSFDAAIAMLRMTLARLSRANSKIAALGLLDVHARVSRLLVESAQEIDGQWVVVVVGSEKIAPFGRGIARDGEPRC